MDDQRKYWATLFLFLIFLVTWTTASNGQDKTLVKTTSGYIRGNAERGILVFKGIPYAAPPVGKLRFLPPVTHPPWRDTLPALSFGHSSLQASRQGISGSEDCLYLNVYTPMIGGKALPVLLWIHGGGLETGAGSRYDGHAFADHDSVVTVTINYRLGILGFMYLGTWLGRKYQASGNNGLLDCVAALHWIKENICAFGGDPHRVTVMGESAGAKLVSSLLVCSNSKGLFQQIIAESGSIQTIRDTGTAKLASLRIFKALNLSPLDADSLLTMPSEKLLKAQQEATSGIRGLMFFGPVDDGVVMGGNPYQYISEGKAPRVRALMGTNQTEMTSFLIWDTVLNHPDAAIMTSLFGQNGEVVYNRYLQMEKTLGSQEAAVRVLTQYTFQMHAYRLAGALARGGSTVWMYRFDFDKGGSGAGHAMELPFVWNREMPVFIPPRRRFLASFEFYDPVWKPLEEQVHGTWANFIRTGDPNNPSIPDWKPFLPSSPRVMTINSSWALIRMDSIFNDPDFPSAAYILK